MYKILTIAGNGLSRRTRGRRQTAATWCSCILLVLTGCARHICEPPTMGWSSWNTYRVHISEELIRRQADAMKATGLQEAGYLYINIDDGFFGGRDSTGQLLPHPERFPNGLKPVADYIHSLGFKAGIYSDAGRNTCGSYWDKDRKGTGVGLYGHDEQDADYYFRRCGFDFIKVDFCGGDPAQNTDRLKLDEQERYTAIRRAIDRKGSMRVRMNVCRWAFPGTWVHDVASSWRISPDINASWASVKGIIERNLHLSAYAGGGRYNDMDMLEIGRGLTDTEEQTHFGMWCMMSSPLLVGCDMTAIPDASLRLLKNPELIAIDQDRLGQQARVYGRANGVWLLAKDLEKTEGRTRAVALYNPTDSAHTFLLRGTDIGLGGCLKTRDAMTRTDLPELRDASTAYPLRIEAHGVRILRLTAEERLETTRYEAEWAWLNRYQELWNTADGIRCETGEGLSAGAKVSHAGGTPDNWLEWRDVQCRKSGTYTLTLHYACCDDRSVTLTVNGKEAATATHLNSGSPTTIACKDFTVRLKRGRNIIRLGHDTERLPDTDCITLRHTGR